MLNDQVIQRWPDLERRRNRLRLEDFDYGDPNHVFFVTICARHLRQPFSDANLADQVTESVLFLSRSNEWRLYTYA